MQSNIAPDGMVVTPHHLATQTAVKVLREGGTAMEAMVAAAATIAVVYPHMNSIGGDSFWLIVPPHGDPVAIEACGAAGSLATEEFFKGYDKIPYKGPKAAITVPGTVGGWQEVLKYVTECGFSKMPNHTILADAINYAENGFAVTESHRNCLVEYKDSNNITHEFAKVFLPDRKIPDVGDKCVQKVLANTLRSLARQGFDSFYKGEVAEKIAEDMTVLGLPITESDLANYSPLRKAPLRLLHSLGEMYNLPAPTQGIASLLILGMLDKLGIDGKDEGKLIHTIVEATKQAFELRNEHITDPQHMKVDPQSLLNCKTIATLANKISFEHASSIDKGNEPGDTVWMGAMDNKGYTVGIIQSTFHEFGSGIILPNTGIICTNRGVTFTLEKNHLLSVLPGKKPFYTLNIAAAKMNDGRVMIYGTRGGEGQPQTQAAIFHRYAVQNINLQAAISAPRWKYGKNYGLVCDYRDVLKIEDRFSEEVIEYLKDRGHEVVLWPAFCEKVGQAGALVRYPNGMMEGAFDPRSNGSAAGF